MSGAATLNALLSANVGDGIEVLGRLHAIAAVGEWSGSDGFRTREFTLGVDEDLYLVIVGVLDGDDQERCRAVLTHELNPNEVRYLPQNRGKSQPVTSALQQSDLAPSEVIYQGRRYRFSRRLVGRYASDARRGPRITWDYESPSRNLAVERWPEQNEMAVYEGKTLPLSTLRVIPNYRAPIDKSVANGPLIGMVVGVIMMIVGFLLLSV